MFMAPRIGIDTKHFGANPSGIAQATLPWVQALIAAHPEWQYLAVGPQVGNQQLEAPNLGTQQIEFPWKPPYGPYLYNLTSFPLRFKPQSVDLLYSPYYDLLLPKGTTSVMSIHDLLYFRLPGLYKAPLVSFYQWIAKRNAQEARALITDSKQSQRDIVRFLGVPESKVHLVYPSLDPTWHEPALTENPWSQTTQDGKKRLLYTGGLEARKNLARLAQAVKQLGPEFQLWVTGDRKNFARSVPEFRLLDEANQVLWLGQVRQDQIKGLYEACDVLVYPSLWEGFGMPVLEARATGLPVACSKMSSIPEVAGDQAFYFDPLSIEEMAESIRAASAAGRGQAEFPAPFSGETNHRRFVQVLEQALS